MKQKREELNERNFKEMIFTKEEIEKLRKEAETNVDAALVLLMLTTGMRFNEALSISKECISLEEMTIRICETKTNSIRLIKIDEAILPIIQKLLSYNADSDFLISDKNGKTFSIQDYQAKHWYPLMRSLHMKHRPYDARHTFFSERM